MGIFTKKEKKSLGIYIHVPFCRSKCQYCDFYSLTEKDDRLMEDYMDAVCEHIKEAGLRSPGYLVDTVYFGGGTPSFFGADGMAVILTAIRRNFEVSGSAEITFEANPDSVSTRLLRRLRSEGFNRVSLGVQCDDDRILKRIGRPHNYEQAVQAMKNIRSAGFKNLSVDLIYGLPEQTLESWQKSLQNVLEMRPEHISCYGLKVEEGTPLYECREYSNLPDDDLQADMYLSTVEILRNKGYRQYEISNFARRGYESKHNMKYWTGGEYLGFGPDASSDFAGKRFKIVRDLRGYIAGIQNRGAVLDEVEEITDRERAGEYLMMRLRTVQGIDREEYEKRFLLPFKPLEVYLEQCRQQGYALGAEGRWRLTPEGFLLSNSILTELLTIQENSEPLAKRR